MAAGTGNNMIDCSELPKGIFICQMVINGEIVGYYTIGEEIIVN